MLNKVLLSTVAVCALTVSSIAADLPARSSAPAPSSPLASMTWNGFYVGASAGLVAQQTDWKTVSDYHASGTGNGGLVGIQGGYNHQIGAMVFGLEADYSISNASSNVTAYSGYTETARTRMTALGTVRARAGYVIGNSLVYATGGFAWGRFKGSETSCDADFKSTRTGYALGAGIEHKLGNNVSLKLEGLYTDLGKISSDYNGCAQTFKNTATVGRIGLNYKF